MATQTIVIETMLDAGPRATPGEPRSRTVPADASASPAVGRAWRVAVVAGGVFAYIAVQVQLEQHDWAEFARMERAGGALPDQLVHASWITQVLENQFLLFASFALGAALLARRGPRWFAVPIALWVAPSFFGAHGSGFLPQPLGAAWTSGFGATSATRLWIGAVLDVGLCAIVAGAAWRRAGIRSMPGRRSCIAGATVVAAAVLLVAAAPHLYGPTDIALTTNVFQLGALALLAAGVAPNRVSTAVALSLIVVGLTAGTTGLTDPLSLGAWRDMFTISYGIWIPYAIVTVAGASWLPLARLIARTELRPGRLVVICNGLNLADAAFTWMFVAHGMAAESNPFVASTGLLTKLVVVGAASLLLRRYRPMALVWMNVALAAVLGWHLLGWTASTNLAWWT